jgi:DNA polymerase-3 subunit delta'
MQFKDIIGQQAVRETLLTAVQNNRISHAQLFTGEAGTGKLALAIAFAQYISCTNKQGNDSCGECPSCKKYQKLIHPDLHFVFPVIKTNALKQPVSDDYISQWREMVQEDPYFHLNEWYAHIGADNKQGMIYAHESDNIIRKLSYKSYESEYKIMIIWQPEKMNIQCANKLLKMIEEPPSKTVFLLVSDNPDNIIKTILSRTQRIKIPRIETDVIADSLVKKYAIQSSKAGTLARLASGSWSKACTLVETSEQDLQNLEAFKTIMRHCWSRKVLEIIEWSKELASLGRERQKSFLLYALKMIRENFIMNIDRSELVYMSDEEKSFSQNFSPYINEANVLKIYSELEKSHSDISRNGNAKIVFLDLGLKLVKLIRP